jgi:phosphate starvation-inducible PhoH-like protein
MRHLRMIELRLGVEIGNRGNIFRVTGPRPRRRPEEAAAELWRDAASES